MRITLHQLRTRLAHRVLCVLLPALLFAQWLGLAHQIAHAGHGSAALAIASQTLQQAEPQASPQAQQLADFGGFGDPKRHSCTAFDAATLGECIHSTPVLPVIVEHAPNFAATPLLILWAPFPQIHFLTRAPPRAVVA